MSNSREFHCLMIAAVVPDEASKDRGGTVCVRLGFSLEKASTNISKRNRSIKQKQNNIPEFETDANGHLQHFSSSVCTGCCTLQVLLSCSVKLPLVVEWNHSPLLLPVCPVQTRARLLRKTLQLKHRTTLICGVKM